ncbi:YbjN domain-containing protein [Caulobacter sp. 17J80-11]|uniref:YbjN domain-containing protein n=1 Tax=Caulobacter sp. 17J80-11 TaxID=2763502 RepID=UPI001653733D|nr:YbjN domain-containing protein [Caulobacter sp. 17J80-11]MBC6982741.1 YbjN domain-containing protein [Caulobacter sp. 17J80-11]
MTRWIAIATAALVAAAGGGAAAKDIPGGGLTVEEVAEWLGAQGYKADLEKVEGETHVASAADGVNFDIYMYDCKDQGRCSALQFSAGFDLTDGTDLDTVNSWNKANRYVKAHLDETKDPFFQYDVNLSPGGTYEALDDDFGVWLMQLPKIKAQIDW